TGSLGEVLKESTTIVYTFVKSLLVRKFPKNAFFDTAHIHLHCPGGATSKDDPSAGIAMAISLLSLVFNQPVSSNIATTGEMTITGKVLKVDELR
ncbi:ribosomal protein S5 domain 2-like protein, partial [Backusella circina FSU 941]